jgi:hypothetical protein
MSRRTLKATGRGEGEESRRRRDEVTKEDEWEPGRDFRFGGWDGEFGPGDDTTEGKNVGSVCSFEQHDVSFVP